MSSNKVNKTTGELVTLANGMRCWIGTKAAHDAAVQAGTMPNNCMVALTDDYEDATVDVVEDGNMHPVTSNAVYDAFAKMDAVIQASKDSRGWIQIPCPIIWDGNTSRNSLMYFTDFYLLSMYDINVQEVSIQGVANYQPSQFTAERFGNLVRVTYNSVTTNYAGRLGFIRFTLTEKS